MFGNIFRLKERPTQAASARPPVVPRLADAFDQQARATLAVEALAEAVHKADRELAGIGPLPYALLSGPEKAVLRGRAAVALNLANADECARAIENAAVRLRLDHEIYAVHIDVARQLANDAIAVWLSWMTGARGR